jgi:hypothetical protein
MASQLELISRAALCRRLAKREPANQALWMAEAENWSRLSKERSFAARREQKSAQEPGACVAKLQPARHCRADVPVDKDR